MLVVLPFHAGDAPQLMNLLLWIKQLGGAKEYGALFVADAGVDWQTVVRAQKLAGESFLFTEVITNAESVKGWPQGPNSLFQAAADYCRREKISPWLWLETDAVPLTPDWARQLAASYESLDAPFVGHIYECHQPGLPSQVMSGVALYPWDADEVLGKFILQFPETAFDVVAAPYVLRQAKHTEAIQHFWGEPNLPPSFPQHCAEKHHFTLDKLKTNAVLFHRNKDGTLIDRLRERAGLRPAHVEGITQPARGFVTVRRSAALGDVLAATVVGHKLMEQGYDVVFQAHPSAHCILRRVVPPFKAIVEPGGNAQVNLDGAYESHPRRRELHFAEMFIERANTQLAPLRIAAAKNFAPRMQLTDADRDQAFKILSNHPRPWIIICPRSNSWANRTVPDATWQGVANRLPGTKFWLALHPAPPGNLVDLNCRHFDTAIGLLGVADLLVSVDTGPLHVAAALGTPAVAVQQASSPELHLSDQRDWVMVSPTLNCLNCQIDLCPINAQVPPCQTITPEVIAKVAQEKLQAVTGDGVSVVMAVYKPAVERLNRALTAVLPQVDEIVVVADAAGVVPRDALQHPKIRYLRMKPANVGYGRKANYGFRHTNHRFVLLLNDDLYLAPDAVAKLRSQMGLEVGMVAHLLRYPDGTIQHGGTYRAPGVPGWGHIDHRAREHRFKEPLEMENVCGASVLVRRAAFYDAGGFDEDFYLYCEDNALCLAVRRAGWKIMYTPHAEGIHDESQSTSVTPRIHEIMQQSHETLKAKWGWYFELNKHNSMGVFE